MTTVVWRRWLLYLLLPAGIFVFENCSKKSTPEKPPEAKKPAVMVSTADMDVDILRYVNQHRKSKGRVPCNSIALNLPLLYSIAKIWQPAGRHLDIKGLTFA